MSAVGIQAPFRPKGWRLLLAFIAAPLAGAFAAVFVLLVVPGIVSGSLNFGDVIRRISGSAEIALLIGTMLGYPPTVLISLPLYLAFRHRIGHGVLGPILVGGLTTLVPCLLLDVLDVSGGAVHGRSCSLDPQGCFLMHGWDYLLTPLAGLLVGCFSGVVFWLVAVWRDLWLGALALNDLPRRVL